MYSISSKFARENNILSSSVHQHQHHKKVESIHLPPLHIMDQEHYLFLSSVNIFDVFNNCSAAWDTKMALNVIKILILNKICLID